MKKRRLPLRNPCASCAPIISIYCSSTSRSVIITVPIAQWKNCTRLAGSARSAFPTLVLTGIWTSSTSAEVKPAVNQIETHVFQQQKTAKEYLKKYGCQIESWGPFAEGRKDMFTNPVLTQIGEKYGKTAAQTALRFLLQSDVVVIPKSTHKDRMQQNFDLFDFTLTPEDMAAIEALDGGESLFFSHYDPKTVEWFMSIL